MKRTLRKIKSKISFFNTTKITGEKLEVQKVKAKAVEYQVFKLFTEDNKLTSDDCFNELGKIYMKTSIRRCLSNLKKSSLIIKTNEKKPGSHGVPLVVWVKS